MKRLEEQRFSIKLQELISEVNKQVSPNKINIYEVDTLPMDVDAQSIKEEYTIIVNPKFNEDEYVISHELLHLISNSVGIPSLVMALDNDLYGMIAAELQGYLEHNWIIAEQKRRGFDVDELAFYKNIQDTIRKDQSSLQQNIKRIMILNNLIHTHPVVFKQYKSFFEINNPSSLEYSSRIMSHYNRKEIYTIEEARINTSKALNEWKRIFKENNIDPLPLSMFIIVKPVFSQAHLRRKANIVLRLLPDAIVNHENGEMLHIIQTTSNDQCCTILQMEDSQFEILQDSFNSMILSDFLKKVRIPYFLR